MGAHAVSRSFGQSQVQQHQSEWTRIQEADAQRRAREDMERRLRDVELTANATPETLYKKRESVVETMFNRGQMGAEQLRAAAEIARVFQAVGCELHARTSRYGAVSGGSADWPVILGIAYRDRYTPWREEQGRILVSRGRTPCELVFKLVVDNVGPRQAADHFGMDQRTLKAAVCESLYRYAEISQWIDPRQLPLFAVPHSEVEAA